MRLRFVVCALAALILPSCGDNPASSSEVPDLEVVLSELLPTALTQESQWRQKLMGQASDRHNELSSITVGAPDEVTAAKAVLRALQEELEAKLNAADAPVVAAAAALNQLTDTAPGFYENTKRRCGSDGCGGLCPDKCRIDEVCRGSWCSCVPDCAGRVCGPDGCGGFCGDGTCGDEASCDKEGQCIANIVSTDRCVPECRREVTPYVARQSSKAAVRDRSTTSRPRDYRTFSSLEELQSIVSTMQSKSAAHSAEIERIAGLTSALQSAKVVQQEVKDSIKSLGEKEKELKKTSRDATKAARQAKRKKQPDLAALEATAAQAKEALDQVRNERKAMKADLKKKTKEIRDMERELKRSKKRTSDLQKAKARIDAEAKRLQGESKVLQDRVAAEAALEAAKTKAKADKEALTQEYAPKLEAAQEKLNALMAPALPEQITPRWNGQSPTAATSALVIRIGKNSRLSGYIAAVNKVRKHWAGRYSAEAAIKASGDPNIDPEDNAWTRANALMHDQIVICEQLLESSERMIRIQDAMQSARDRSGL